MELYGTKTSPFTRIVRIIAAELGFNPGFREKAWRKDSEAIYKLNPAGRIPVLADEGRRICESRIICSYLMEHEKAQSDGSFRMLRGPHRWEEENVLSMIYGSLESLAILSYFRDPPPVSHPYIDRNQGRIDACFAELDTLSSKGYLIDKDRFGLAEAALTTAMDIIEGRNFARIDTFRNVQDIRSRFQFRPSVAGTAPDFTGRDK